MSTKGGAMLCVLLLACAVPSAAGVRAADPPAVTVDPESSGNRTATYKGSAIMGSDDGLGQLGQSYQKCHASGPPMCEQELVHIVTTPSFAETHTVGIKATVTSSDGGGLDVAIFDAAGNLLASNIAGTSPTSIAVDHLAPGDYVVQVDGDVATGGTYVGVVEASAGPRQLIPVLTPGTVGFGRETIADPLRTGFEPSVIVAADGTTYESPILGFNNAQSCINSSHDGGPTIKTMGAPGVGKVIGTPVPGSTPICGGGGDVDTATDRFPGDLFAVDLAGGPSVAAYASHDRAGTFVTNCLANQNSGINSFTDREWLSTDLVHRRLWYFYRDGIVGGATASDDVNNHVFGEHIRWAPLPGAAGTAGAAQVSFSSLCRDPAGLDTACFGDVALAGAAVTDNTGPQAGNTYLPFSSGLGIELAVVNPSASTAVTVRRVAHASPVQFPSVAVDRSGNLYMVWSDATTFRIMFTRSSDEGRTWSKPIAINGSPARVAIMPWIVAGDAGRVDVAFYGSGQDAYPGINYGPWDGYMLQSLDALGAQPRFSQARFTDRPNHLDPICLGGLACNLSTGPTADRALGDFFKVALDSTGRAVVSFADTANQLGPESFGGPVVSPAFAEYVRQAVGPSLFGEVGTVPPIAVPTGHVERPPHENPVPVTSIAGPGPSVDALNLVAGSTRLRTDGSIETTLTVKDLDSLAAVSRPPFIGNATFLTRWNFNSQVFYAAAEDNGGKWRFYSGGIQPVPGVVGVLYPAYPAMGPATGYVRTGPGGVITIDTPGSAVGRPSRSDTLFSVTSYALTESSPTPPTGAPASASTFPLIADSLPAYNVEPRNPTAGRGPSTPAGSGLPDTRAQRPWQLLVVVAAGATIIWGFVSRLSRRLFH